MTLFSSFSPPFLFHLNVFLILSSYPPPPPITTGGRMVRSLSQGSTNSNMMDVQVGGHKKRVRRSSLLNAKKLYEDAQMARKVKQYLSNLAVETDEEKHQIMSLQCEPSYSTCESRNSIGFLTSLCWSFLRSFFSLQPFTSTSECNRSFFLL